MSKIVNRTKVKKIDLKLALKDPKVRQASIMLSASCVVMVIALVALNSLGFFHMLVGWTIPRGTVKQGVIFEKNQVESIPDGEIRYRLNTNVVFENLYSQGSIMLENPKVSEYYLEFSFYLPKDQNTPFYQSPRLAPGECLLNDKLTDRLSLKRGRYSCICVVRAYDEAGEYQGKNTCSVRVDILDN